MFKSLKIAIATIVALLLGALTPVPANATASCTINITTSNTTIDGTANGDVICINADNVTINALGGNDTIVDNGIGNIIYLGDGNDIYDGTLGDDSTVDGGSGNDTITGTPGEDEITGGDGDDTLIGGESDDTIAGGAGNDNLEGDAGADDLSGEVGNDDIDGGDGTDAVDGGVGDDTLVGGSANDVMNGGAGADNLSGSAGDDQILGDAGNDTLNGGDGTDTVDGGVGDDTLVGGAANDVLNGGEGTDRLEGSAGNDELYGEAGTDSIFGGLGDDVLVGGTGVDQVDGGTGLNMCDYTSGEPLVSTCTYDDVGPVLESVSFSSSTVDVSSSGQEVTVTLQISDSTGISNGFFGCTSGGREAILIYFSYRNASAWNINSPVTNVNWSGTSKNATLTATQTVENGLFPGTYSCSTSLTDVLLQTSVTSRSSLIVVRTGDGFDDVGPAIGGPTFSANPVEVGIAGQTTRVTLQLSDQTGLRNGWFQCSVNTPNSERSTDAILAYFTWSGKQLSNGYSNLSLVSWTGTATNSTLVFDVTVPLGFRPGDYPCGVTLFDTKNQQAQQNNVATFQVSRTGNSFDDSAPVIESFEVSPNPVDVGSSAVDTDVTLRLTDATGIRNGYVSCYYSTWGSPSYRKAFLVYYTWSSRSIYSESGNDRLVSFTGTDTDATLRVKGHVPMGLSPGAYTCWVSATDTLDHSISKSFTLNVLRTPPGMPSAPTALEFSPSDNKPTEGVLTWDAPTSEGDPALYTYEIQYSIDGISWTTISRSNSRSTSISLANLRVDADYSFRIRGENGGNGIVGSAGAAWSEVLEVRTPPPLAPLPPTLLNVSSITSTGFALNWTSSSYDGGAAISNVTVELSRDGGITWTSARGAVSTSSSVTVSGASPGTEYQIRIAASNSVGLSEYLTGSVTTVNVAPYAPQNLRSTSVAPTSLTLLWDLPSSNGGSGITDYKVEFSSNAGTTWNTIAHDPSAVRSFNVTGLAKGRSYQFRVSALNSVGTGAVSAVHTVVTLTTVPDVPTALSSSLVTSSTARLSWTAPTDNGGSAITDYTVQTSRDDGVTWVTVAHTASTTAAMNLTGLAPGTRYLFRVATRTAVGLSDWVQGELTTTTVAPGAPLNFTSSSVLATSLTLSWDLPTSNGGAAIADYKVEFSSNGGTTWNVIAHDPSAVRSFNVTGLTRATAYQFRVTAKNSIGFGVASAVHRVTTLADVPSAPTALRVTAITASGAALGWTAPTNTGGAAVSDYMVEVSRDSGSTWSMIPRTVSTSRTFVVSGLAPGTTYQVRVSAKNSAGYSTYLSSSFTTLTTVPGTIANLATSNVLGTSLSLTWDLPASNGGSAITNYQIQVSSNGTKFTNVSKAVSNSRTFNVTSGLAAGTKFWFRVAAINSIGTGAVSNAVEVVTVGNAPSAPTSLAVKPSKTSIVLSWAAATVSGGSAVRDYTVEYSSNSGASWTTVTKAKSTSRSMTVTGLRRATAYLFRVSAVNDVGSSAPSANLAVNTR
jgi:fibronectin type 3 domain-containing protein